MQRYSLVLVRSVLVLAAAGMLTACNSEGNAPWNADSPGSLWNGAAGNAPPSSQSAAEPVAVSGDAVTVSWDPPTQRVDGSALTEIDSYTIHYGRSEHELDERVAVDNPGLSSYVVENLEAGNWYFAMTVSDSDGRESGYSEVAAVALE